jgi:hypothetical protein
MSLCFMAYNFCRGTHDAGQGERRVHVSSAMVAGGSNPGIMSVLHDDAGDR